MNKVADRPSPVEMNDVRAQLDDLETLNYERRPFIPHDALKHLLSESRVAALVGALSDKGEIEVWQQPEIIGLIVNNGLRVFATLLSFSQPGLILKFKETDHLAYSQLDSRLPLSENSLGLIFRDEKLGGKFFKHQWRFLAPFFRADQSYRELQDSVVLPFTKCERLAAGAFGEVHKMTVAASYQAFVPEGTGEVELSRSFLVLTY